MIIGMHHVGVVTTDIDRLAGFYSDNFFAKRLGEFRWGPGDTALTTRLAAAGSSGRIVMLGFKSGRLELFQFEHLPERLPDRQDAVAKPGFNHVCFQVDDCVAEYARLKALGMPFHAGPLTMPAGGVFAYGRDVDENVVEILQSPQLAAS
ncbi:MAG: VOC family protein [Boseongicola sp. SB0676_bin_33]|uniref:VOC family protein n=1 Tax=Boseongicola sp. SB0664_bin_43 TaxID=2604844 RepID=A0A6B0Y178_9RHOB|nr:VOC family protein [Boseongicola sp. SB0664_bin_43]MYF88329.1 VOC family protein [Boseongicola sp. SB0676_bin_33]